jgi:hypothetical protein
VSPGFGHNSGREPDLGWRRHCWSEARRRLLPTLPIEVIRLRVARARELGLDYRTYASVRAASGHDVVAFLFSSNALRLLAPRDRLPDDRAAKLAALRDCGRLLLAQPPLDPGALAAGIAERHGLRVEAAPAPPAFAPWATLRAAVQAALAPGRVPADGVLLVGDTAFEREWAAAGRLAGYLAAERYFAGPGQSGAEHG